LLQGILSFFLFCPRTRGIDLISLLTKKVTPIVRKVGTISASARWAMEEGKADDDFSVAAASV
jgi:hypothetical protein